MSQDSKIKEKRKKNQDFLLGSMFCHFEMRYRAPIGKSPLPFASQDFSHPFEMTSGSIPRQTFVPYPLTQVRDNSCLGLRYKNQEIGLLVGEQVLSFRNEVQGADREISLALASQDFSHPFEMTSGSIPRQTFAFYPLTQFVIIRVWG